MFSKILKLHWLSGIYIIAEGHFPLQRSTTFHINVLRYLLLVYRVFQEEIAIIQENNPKLPYIDIPQHNDIWSWTFKEIKMPKNVVFLLFHILYLFNVVCYPYTKQVHPWADSQAKPCRGKCAKYRTWNNKDDFNGTNESFSSLINVLMSLRC